MKLFLAMCVAMVLSGAAASAESLEAKADGSAGVFLAATLAPYGSFEWRAAPSYTRLATARRTAAVALRKQTITVGEAKAIQSIADGIRSLLDQAVSACAQDNRTGKCTKNSARANRLLRRAELGLAAIR